MAMEKTEIGKALELVEEFDTLIDSLNEEDITYLWTDPEAVIKEFKRIVQYLKTSFQFTDEMIKEHGGGILIDACQAAKPKHYQS